MTITIPTWLLYTIYAVGGLIAIGIVFVVAAFAFVGWTFTKVWRPPNW